MSLNYDEEEDLFGDETDINPAQPLDIRPTPTPLITPSRPGPQDAGPSKQVYSYPVLATERRKVQDEIRGRMDELREKKRKGAQREYRTKGVSSLKDCCLAVVKVNSGRIWDIGDMEYMMIRPFLDDLPRDQLDEIEQTSPHIKKDTDWLWELFLLDDYPLFHERCRERQGEQRTTGWRRMYKKAKEDAEERQVSAANRVAERYRQLEEEKAAKRIVVMDKLVPDRKAKRATPSARGKAGGAFGPISRAAGPAGAIARARQDAQRARVAMTHASGKYIPPPVRPKSATGQRELFKNPYLAEQRKENPSSTVQHRPTMTGPRIPARRTKPAAVDSPNTSTLDRFDGSFRTSEFNGHRTALPSHLTSSPTPPVTPTSQQRERFKISEEKSKYQTVRRAEVANFEPPKKSTTLVDFFADESKGPKGFMESLNRTSDATTGTNEVAKGIHGEALNRSGQKRQLPADTGIFITKKKRPIPGR